MRHGTRTATQFVFVYFVVVSNQRLKKVWIDIFLGNKIFIEKDLCFVVFVSLIDHVLMEISKLGAFMTVLHWLMMLEAKAI